MVYPFCDKEKGLLILAIEKPETHGDGTHGDVPFVSQTPRDMSTSTSMTKTTASYQSRIPGSSPMAMPTTKTGT